MRTWAMGTAEGDWASMGIPSDGSYGIEPGVIYGYPVTVKDGKYAIVQGLEINDFSRARMDATNKELRDEINLTNSGSWPAIDRLKSEKAAVEEQLRVARDERAKLQREINAIQKQAESSWATERMENALLRERINDIAAEVAKLAMQLEGPNSPIEALLAADPATAKPVKVATAANDAGSAGAPSPGGTLAERIRALQSHASRARQQGA